MAEKFDEFLEEVENDIRQERYKKLWDKYGKMASNAIFIALAGAVAYTAWQNYSVNQRQKNADAFLHTHDLIERGDTSQALLDLQALEQQDSGIYKVLTQFARAALLANDGPQQNIKEAIEIYQSLATNKNIEASWRELATIMEISVKADDYSPAAVQELIDLVKPLAAEGKPWYGLAAELYGSLLFRKGDNVAAGEVFVKLARDNSVPEGVRLRAQVMTQALAKAE
jgi:hypothetical protein